MQRLSRRLVLVALAGCGLLALGVTPALAQPVVDFAPERNVPISPAPIAIAVGDLNRDGIADLAVANSRAATVTIRLGRGGGRFGGPHAVAVARGTLSLAVADLDRDGRLDLITTATVGYGKPVRVCVRLGKGDGRFASPHLYRFASDVGPYSYGPLAIADVNRDGRPDVVTSWGLKVIVLPGRAGGALGHKRAFPADVDDTGNDGAIATLVVGDLNGDHNKDVVVGGYEGVNQPDGILGVLLGKGNGAFKAAVTSHSRQFLPGGLALADLNHDGARDLVARYMVDGQDYDHGYNYGSLIVSLGTGRGGFVRNGEYDFTAEEELGGPEVADFDGDGERDVAVGVGRGIEVLLGNGDGSLRPGVAFGREPWKRAEMTARGEFNKDGKPDLAAASGANTGKTVAIFINRSR